MSQVTFRELPDEVQKSTFEKVRDCFKECHYDIRSIEPFSDMFGKYNAIAYVRHPAFVSGLASPATFDGVSGKVKLRSRISVLYGGLNCDDDRKEYDINNEAEREELVNRLFWMRVTIDRIKPEEITNDMVEKFRHK